MRLYTAFLVNRFLHCRLSAAYKKSAGQGALAVRCKCAPRPNSMDIVRLPSLIYRPLRGCYGRCADFVTAARMLWPLYKKICGNRKRDAPERVPFSKCVVYFFGSVSGIDSDFLTTVFPDFFSGFSSSGSSAAIASASHAARTLFMRSVSAVKCWIRFSK